MPATSVEVYLRRTLHYVFLRHDDPQAARKMGETAAAVIGNPTEFDLNFRTSRVIELKGKPLTGEKICTYCAGLLVPLCAGNRLAAARSSFRWRKARREDVRRRTWPS